MNVLGRYELLLLLHLLRSVESWRDGRVASAVVALQHHVRRAGLSDAADRAAVLAAALLLLGDERRVQVGLELWLHVLRSRALRELISIDLHLP